MIFKNKTLKFFFKIALSMALFAIASYFGLLVFGLSIFLSAIVFVFLPTSQEHQFRRAEKKISTTKIAFLKPGIVEISGVCKIIEPTFSKLSNTPCIAYSYKVERVGLVRKLRSARASTTHYTLSYEELCNPFLIEDETGSVKIEPDGLIINSFYNQKTEREAGRQFTEKTILEGEKIIIIGEAIRKNGTYIIQNGNSITPFYLNSEAGLKNFKENKPLRKKILGYSIGFLVLFSIILVVDNEFLEKGISGFTLNLNILQEYKLGILLSCIYSFYSTFYCANS